MTHRFVGRAFGLRWGSCHALRLFLADQDECGSVDVIVERVPVLPPRPGGHNVNNGEVFADGARFRFDGAIFDIFDGRLVRWQAGPDVHDLPLAFYGTVTGLLLACRGLVPLHGSAIAIDGSAILIAGRSGAGKSTLCHELTKRGGLLVSDDLSALAPMDAHDRPMLWPGRPSIRLAPNTGEDHQSEKVLVTPLLVDPYQPIELRTLILLRDIPLAPGAAEASRALAEQIFRPRWMAALPGTAARQRTMFLAAQRIAIHVLPSAAVASAPADARAEQVLRLPRRSPSMDSIKPSQ